MIIVRSPLRITLGGGGTDVPSFYENYGGGFLIAAAIDKYVYVTVNKTYLNETLIRYSKIEKVNDLASIEHPIIRESLKIVGIRNTNIEITSMADISAGTGLGSSGSFTTALIKALKKYKNEFIHPNELAEAACHIEINLLNEPIGKQDQYIAAFGGITCFEFSRESVNAYPLKVPTEKLSELRDSIIIFSLQKTRSSSKILAEQNKETLTGQSRMIDNLNYVKEIGYKSQAALETGNFEEFGELLNLHWEYKKKRSKFMSSPDIDNWYKIAMKNGALGGKVIGAGGGGFLMFFSKDPFKLRNAMKKAGLIEELRFDFDFDGTKIID